MKLAKVLIVEDEVNIREVYSEVLRDAGFDVEESGDGNDGFAKAMAGNWNVLLLDIMLPKKDGLEILKSLKDNPATKGKPVVLLTNLGRDSIVKEGYNLGAAAYVIKSEINPDQVVDTVNKVLSATISNG